MGFSRQGDRTMARRGLTRKQLAEGEAADMAKLFRSKQAAAADKEADRVLANNERVASIRQARAERVASEAAEHAAHVKSAREHAAAAEAAREKESERVSEYLSRPKPQPPRIAGPAAEPPEAESVREKPHSHVDGNELPAAARLILVALRSSPGGLSRSRVRRQVFNDNVPASQVGEWLNGLLARGLVNLDTVRTAGRYAEVWSIRRRRRR
jgi:hypothetical protein